MNQKTRKQTAFVLAGGGSLGAVQVGMLKALCDHGVKPDLVVGASVGAINGAYFAGHPDAVGVKGLEKIWRQLHSSDIFPISVLNTLRLLISKRQYFVSPEPLTQVIRKALPFEKLEDARIPFHVVATDLYDGIDICLSEGPAEKALLASSSIPGVFPPVRYDDRYLVDGGVANNTPISTAIKLGATRLVVLPTGFSCSIDHAPSHIAGMVLHALNMLIMRQLARDTEYYGNRAEIIVVPPLCPVNVTPYDFSQTASLIDRANVNTAAWLAKDGLQPAGVPHELELHHDEE